MKEEPSHLLDLLQSALLGQSQPNKSSNLRKKGSRRHRLKEESGGSVADGKTAYNGAFDSLFDTSRSLKLSGSISNRVERVS